MKGFEYNEYSRLCVAGESCFQEITCTLKTPVAVTLSLAIMSYLYDRQTDRYFIDRNKVINPYSAGIDFNRQNLTSVDVRF